MRKIILLMIILFCFVIAITWAAPHAVSNYLEKKAAEACQSCEIKWSKTQISLFPVSIEVRDLTFDWGQAQATQIKASIRSITAAPVLLSFFRSTPVIRGIMVKNPKVIVTEGDRKMPSSHPGEKTKGELGVFISEIRLLNGDFTYRKNHRQDKKTVSGKVHLHNINAKAYPVGNRQTANAPFEVAMTAILEHSGKVDLKLHFPDWANRSIVNIFLDIKSFDLNQSNAYFKDIESLNLSGKLGEGSSFVDLNGNHLSAWVRARYSGLKLEFLNTGERSALSAKISTIVSQKNINSDKSEMSGPRAKQTIQLNRQNEETHLSFIFRGLKEAALAEVKR